MKRGRALVVVDIQRDFCPGGSLPIKRGDEVIEPTNRLISLFEREKFPIFFTRDWHPADHCSFRFRGGPWPPHCVKNTPGAEFHPSLHVPNDAVVISKATKKDFEAYSGFQGTDLAARLNDLEVGEVLVAGLATDYCVKNTVLDGISNGFRMTVVSDCVRGVNVKPGDSANAFRAMVAGGARKMTIDEALRTIDGRRVAVSSSS